MNKYLLINLLKQGGYFMVNKILIKKLGLVEASVLALLLDMNAQHGDNFFVTADTAKDMLNLGRRPYDSAIASLKESGIITTYLKCAPPKTYFIINYEIIASFFEDVQNGQIDLYKTDISICSERSTNNNKDNNTPYNNPTLFEDKSSHKDSIISPKGGESAPVDDGFDAAWKAYGRKGNKMAAHRYWKKLSAKDRKSIMDTIPLYLAAMPDEKFRKDFSGWINPTYRRWEDKIVNNQQQTRKENNNVWTV